METQMTLAFSPQFQFDVTTRQMPSSTLWPNPISLLIPPLFFRRVIYFELGGATSFGDNFLWRGFLRAYRNRTKVFEMPYENDGFTTNVRLQTVTETALTSRPNNMVKWDRAGAHRSIMGLEMVFEADELRLEADRMQFFTGFDPKVDYYLGCLSSHIW